MSPKHLFDFVSRCLHEDLFHVAVYSSPGIATRVPFPHSAAALSLNTDHKPETSLNPKLCKS